MEAKNSPESAEGTTSYEEVEYMEEVEYEEVEEEEEEEVEEEEEENGGAGEKATSPKKAATPTPAAASPEKKNEGSGSKSTSKVGEDPPKPTRTAATAADDTEEEDAEGEDGFKAVDDDGDDDDDEEENNGDEDEDEEGPSVPVSKTTASPGPEPETALTNQINSPVVATKEGVSSAKAVDSLDMEALGEQATKVAADVQKAATESMAKLSAGLTTALAGFGTNSNGSSSLTSGLTSWWGSLDPPKAPKDREQADRVAAANKASSELQSLFSLSAEENLVESFGCKLLQTYGCSHNSYTPAIQMAFQGTLHITDRHTCFSVEERGRKLPFKIEHTQIKKATRQRPARKGDLSDILRLDLANGNFLSMKDFDSGSALDSALALVEHLMEG